MQHDQRPYSKLNELPQITTDYPVVRLVAFDRPGTIVVHKNTSAVDRGNASGTTNEIAVFWKPEKHWTYPNREEGVYAEIRATYQSDYLATCQFYSPTSSRYQIIRNHQCDEWSDAWEWFRTRIDIALRLLDHIRQFPAMDGPVALPIAPGYVLDELGNIEREYGSQYISVYDTTVSEVEKGSD